MKPFRAVEPVEFEADRTGRLAPTVQIGPGTWSVSLPVESEVVRSSFAYLIFDAGGGLHVLDPGLAIEGNWELLTRGIEDAGARLEDVRSSLVTHLHADHLGLAGRLRDETGAPITMHAVEAAAVERAPIAVTEELLQLWGVPEEHRMLLRGSMTRQPPTSVRADRTVEDGDLLDIPGREIRAVWTPGHTRGHLCFADQVEGLTFTGDHVLPAVNPGLGLGGPGVTNPLADYLEALSKVERYDDHVACPGHGYRFDGLAARARAIGAHHRNRLAEVSRIRSENPDADVWQIATRVRWTKGWGALRGRALISALRQTEMHVQYLTADR